MSQVKDKKPTDYMLPSSIVSKTDLSRLVSEFEKLDSDLTAAAIRTKAGSQAAYKPELSDSLREFLVTNRLQVGDGKVRVELIKQFRHIKSNAPVIHMTFSAVADHESLQELANWLRKSIHPQAVISVGLQPALIGGVYLRTPNHVQDLSVRARLSGHRDLLVKELEGLSGRR